MTYKEDMKFHTSNSYIKITKQNDIQRRHEISKTFVSMRLAK